MFRIEKQTFEKLLLGWDTQGLVHPLTSFVDNPLTTRSIYLRHRQGLPRPQEGTKYCDQHVYMSVCLFVCLSVHSYISKTTRPNFAKFVYLLTVAVAGSSSDGIAIC